MPTAMSRRTLKVVVGVGTSVAVFFSYLLWRNWYNHPDQVAVRASKFFTRGDWENLYDLGSQLEKDKCGLNRRNYVKLMEELSQEISFNVKEAKYKGISSREQAGRTYAIISLPFNSKSNFILNGAAYGNKEFYLVAAQGTDRSSLYITDIPLQMTKWTGMSVERAGNSLARIMRRNKVQRLLSYGFDGQYTPESLEGSKGLALNRESN